MKKILAFAVGAFALMTANPVEAQICAGSPSFSSGPIQMGVASRFTGGVQEFGGGIGFGAAKETGPLGFVSAGFMNASDIGSTGTNIGGGFAYEISADKSKRVFVCPAASLGYSNGPDLGDVNISILQWGGGAQVGILAADNDRIGVVPTFGLQAARARLTVGAFGIEESGSDTFGTANIGVGLIFNRNMALTPTVSIPFSLEGGDAAFGIAFTANFGR